MDNIQALAREQYCYLTTTGRKTGKAHTIEIWFAIPAGSRTLYMLAGGGDKSDWVQNIGRNPDVQARIGDQTLAGKGRLVEDTEEDRLARATVVAKYYGRDEVHTSGWEATALPVAVDLQA